MTVPQDVLNSVQLVDGQHRVLALSKVLEDLGNDLEPPTPEANGMTYPPTVFVLPGPRTRQDLVLGALLVVIVCFVWINLATQPFPESLIEPLALAIGYLGWMYTQLDNER